MRRVFFGAAVLVSLAACSDEPSASAAGQCTEAENSAPPPPADSVPFIAFTTNFCGYRRWASFSIANTKAQGNVHVAGPRTAYLNKRPPPGSREFPVGTIIVKELTTGAIEDRSVFAMVKRGGGYDTTGAVNWEWFELKNTPDGNVSRIVWHGFGPPNGLDAYGGDPKVCNTCHAGAKGNDYVQSAELQLAHF